MMLRYCDSCKDANNTNFRNIITLKNSGLIIYEHKEQGSTERRGSLDAIRKQCLIFHNKSNKILQRYEYIMELCQYRTKCFNCKNLIQLIRNLLENITVIKDGDILAICEHCRHKKARYKCKRCNFILKLYFNKLKEERKDLLELWLFKLKHLLLDAVSEDKECPYSPKLLTDHILKPENLNTQRELDITYFPKLDINRIVSPHNKNIKILHREDSLLITGSKFLNERFLSHNSLYVSPPQNRDKGLRKSCAKIVRVSNKVLDTSKSSIRLRSFSPTLKKGKIANKSSKLKNDDKTQLPNYGCIKETPKIKKSQKIKSEIKHKGATHTERALSVRNDVSEIEKCNNSDIHLDLKLITERDKSTGRQVGVQPEKLKILANVTLPSIKLKERKIDTESDDVGSIIQCGIQKSNEPTDMIIGRRIVPYSVKKKKLDTNSCELLNKISSHSSLFQKSEMNVESTKKDIEQRMLNDDSRKCNANSKKGTFTYQLSNQDYVEKGWTKLPLIKIMREMNVYKMLPKNHNFNWFERNKNQRLLFYPTGEKFAVFGEDGHCSLYYKNGSPALDYFMPKEFNADARYIIYNYCEVKRKVLASFDHIGNGVVYDHCGNTRLKYNQCEGIIIDSKIGPPGRWKWHALNDPPILRQVYVETQENNDPCVEKNNEPFGQKEDESSSQQEKDEMIAIERQNIMRSRALKILQKYKPFQIRMKVFKMNDYFSLRIYDQTNIHVVFRCDRISIKFSIGMTLLSDKIIDTESVEVAQVTMPYDRLVPKSDNVADIPKNI